jgi:hypothetical protein
MFSAIFFFLVLKSGPVAYPIGPPGEDGRSGRCLSPLHLAPVSPGGVWVPRLWYGSKASSYWLWRAFRCRYLRIRSAGAIGLEPSRGLPRFVTAAIFLTGGVFVTLVVTGISGGFRNGIFCHGLSGEFGLAHFSEVVLAAHVFSLTTTVSICGGCLILILSKGCLGGFSQRRRRHQVRRPPHAAIRPGSPAPMTGPGTCAGVPKGWLQMAPARCA